MNTDDERGNILIVDDTPENLRLLSRTLAERGHRIRATRSGLEALASIQATPPDLVLLDVRMPDLDGYEVCARLKANPATRDVPVLFLSALTETQDKLHGFAVGGIDYITKPFQAEEVLARVETHLRMRRLQRALDAANGELRADQATLGAQNAELQQIQHSLEESRNRYLDLYDFAPVGYFTFTHDGQIAEVNLTGAAFLGVERPALLHRAFEDFVAPEDRELWTRHLARLIEAPGNQSCDLVLNLQGGATIHARLDSVWLALSTAGGGASDATPVVRTAVSGGPPRVRTALSDITARKLAEQRAFELALERERVGILTKFIQDASHEFGTPLAIMQTNLYLLARLEDPAKRQRKLAQIGDQVTGLTRLVDLLAQMARLDSGVPFMTQPTDLNLLVGAVTAKMQAQIAAQGLTLHLALAPDLPPVAADGNRLGRALQELLDNAVRFTPAGGNVTVRTAGDAEDVTVEVQDTGPGIAAEVLPRLFERFFRQDVAHTTPGFGLGLPIARAIVERHGGRLEVESQGDGGSVFRMTLPA